MILHKREFDILGILFAAEIEAGVKNEPLLALVQRRWGKKQLASLQMLEGMGMVEETAITGRVFSVSGWTLTLLGHQTYCAHCAQLPSHETDT